MRPIDEVTCSGPIEGEDGEKEREENQNFSVTNRSSPSYA